MVLMLCYINYVTAVLTTSIPWINEVFILSTSFTALINNIAQVLTNCHPTTFTFTSILSQKNTRIMSFEFTLLIPINLCSKFYNQA